MTSLWFQSFLLPDGWAERVRIDIDQGRIHSHRGGRIASSLARNATRSACPVFPTFTATLSSERWRAAPRSPRPTGDNFWSWRETMYRFVDAIGPDDMEAIAAFAYMEMLEAGFTRVGEFHYVHHDRGGQTIFGPRRDGEPHRRGCARRSGSA